MHELSVIKAIILGALQGATEFLPVSSSGHLVIAQDLLGVRMDGGQLLAFDVCLHFGTLIAVLAVFWRDLLNIIAGFARPSSAKGCEGRRLGFMLVAATAPAVIVGIPLKDFFASLVSNPMAAAAMLLVTGTFLWLTRFSKVKQDNSGLSWFRIILIGCAQAVAIIPGISRSGSTISAGLFLGIDRPLAARFSFLLSVPVILGVTVLEFKELKALSGDVMLAVIFGTLVSSIVGFACIKWLLSIIRGGRFSLFGYYCWAVGLSFIVYKSLI